MPKGEPFTWLPADVVEVKNASDENLLLELESGPMRLDRGRTLRLTASGLQQPGIKALVDSGKITVQPFRKK